MLYMIPLTIYREKTMRYIIIYPHNYVMLMRVITTGYCNILTSVLENYRLSILNYLAIGNPYMPMRYHSDATIFDKLILQYIDVSNNERQRNSDIEKFNLLVTIYQK